MMCENTFKTIKEFQVPEEIGGIIGGRQKWNCESLFSVDEINE